MPVKTGNVTGRRNLRFQNLDQLQQDAQAITSSPHKTLGNWTASQIIDHLANSIKVAYAGPEKYAPWIVRWLIAPMMKSRMLNKGMPAGFQMPRQLSYT